MPAKLALGEPLLPFAAVNGDGAWSPPIDVREHPADYTVVTDLPGVEPTTVEVTADGDVLTITGARRDRLRAGGNSRPLRAADWETPPLATAPPPAATQLKSVRGSATACSRSPCRRVLTAVEPHARR